MRSENSNLICTLFLNGKIYEYGDGEIDSEEWKNWRHNKENIFYVPENFSLNFKIKNKNTKLMKNISVEIGDRNFSDLTIESGEIKNFEIPLRNMELINGRLETEIWLRKDDEPLICKWRGNEAVLSASKSVKIYLLDFNKWRYEQSNKK